MDSEPVKRSTYNSEGDVYMVYDKYISMYMSSTCIQLRVDSMLYTIV